MLSNQTDADEDEFDENEYEPGKFLTEEEKELLLRKIRGEMEDDEDDGSITTVDDDEGIAREDEEDDAGEGDEEDVEDAIDNDDAADTISVEDARADPVQILRQVFGRSKSPNVDEESDVEVAAMEEDVETSQIGDHHAKVICLLIVRLVLYDGFRMPLVIRIARCGDMARVGTAMQVLIMMICQRQRSRPPLLPLPLRPARVGVPLSFTPLFFHLTICDLDYHQPVVEEGVVEDRPARMDSAEQDDSHSVTTMKTSKTTKSHRVRTGNAFFRAALEEEARMAKSHGRHSMVEDEAEEEEEEGMQAGLGDFGFGVVGKREDEADALKLRKGDLDHIVDDLSSDEEEDNEEARRKRIELEEQRDKELTRKVIEAVTEGHDKVKQKKGYSFDALVRGRTKDKDGGENAEQPQEELDEEELLQRGLTDRMERMKASRLYANSDSESEDSSVGSDVEEGGLEGGEEGEGDGREDPEAAQEELARQREAERARRKQMEKQFKIQRELRRLRALQGGNGPILPSAVTLPVEESSIALSEVSCHEQLVAVAIVYLIYFDNRMSWGILCARRDYRSARFGKSQRNRDSNQELRGPPWLLWRQRCSHLL